MAHGIFTRNPTQLVVEIRQWQRRLYAARLDSRVAYCRRMIEARLLRLRGYI